MAACFRLIVITQVCRCLDHAFLSIRRASPLHAHLHGRGSAPTQCTAAVVPAERSSQCLVAAPMDSRCVPGLSGDYNAQLVASNVYEVQDDLTPFRVSTFRAGERDHLLSYRQSRPSLGRAVTYGGE